MLSDSAIPTRNRGMAACHRRSRVLSECHAVRSITGIAQSHGMPEIRITCVVLSPEMRRTICRQPRAEADAVGDVAEAGERQDDHLRMPERFHVLSFCALFFRSRSRSSSPVIHWRSSSGSQRASVGRSVR